MAEFTIGGIDLVSAGAIVVGLAAGAVLRSSRHVSANASWTTIRKDLLISMMSGLANFIIAGIVVALGTLTVPGFPVLAAAGVGLFFGHQGPEAINWFQKKFFGGYQPSEPRYAAPPSDDAPKPIEEMAHRLDNPDDPHAH